MDISNNEKDIKDYKKGKETISFSYGKGYYFSSDSSSYIFIAKKTQKILSAVYMITDFLDERDSIKFKIRDLAIELMSDSFSCINIAMSDRAEIISKGQNTIEQILSFFEVIYANKKISNMNFDILYTELLKLQDILSKQFKKLMLSQGNTNNSIEEFSFPETIFSEDKESSVLVKSKTAKKDNFKKDTFLKKNNVFYKKKDIKKNKKDILTGNKKLSNENNFNNQKSNHINDGEKTIKKHSKTERKDQILNLLKQKGELSIKDIIALFINTSEKTIQRDLGELINEGFVIKTGKKRWSKYSLFFV